MSIYDKYEPVIGLEVHMQLLTESKAFSTDSAAYGGDPNTHIDPVSLGHPGTLPRLNEKEIEYAIKLGLACQCIINKVNRFSRKNYFYADLPKGYQITQFDTPICTKGFLKIKFNGQEKEIGITRIHMEEDSGKSIHDLDPFHTLVDLNRAGVPLLEMVSEPDMRSSDEAYQYLTELRKLVRYLEICDGNMEEGSMRCDANISVMLKGSKEFGQKVEVKNINSIRNVQRAIEAEIIRQIDLIENGGTVTQDTRGFDAVGGKTFPMRTKEMAHEYRYFPEPDLPPVILTDNQIDKVHEQMPALPEELFNKYVKELKLPEYDAKVLTDDKDVVQYFERLICHTSDYKAAANWVMGDVKSYVNEKAIHMDEFPVPPEKIAELIKIIDEGKISHSVGSQHVFPELVKDAGRSPLEIAESLNLIQESDESFLNELIEEALSKYPEKIEEYRGGKKGVLGLFMGEVMKLSKGKADPREANKLLKEKLEN